MIDTETYDGVVYTLPTRVKQQAQEVLAWRQMYPDVVGGFLTDTEWRALNTFVTRHEVGEDTVRAVAAIAGEAEEYRLAVNRARSTREPWAERAIVRYRMWGGTAGLNWANGILNGMEST